KATPRPRTAAASLVPSAVRKTTVPWSTTKLIGKMSGCSLIDTAKRPTWADRSRFQHTSGSWIVMPVLVSVVMLRRCARAPSAGRDLGPRRVAPLRDDEGGDHPEHPGVVLRMSEDVAVPHPRAGLRGVDEHGVALAGGHGHGVLGGRCGQREA